MCFTAFELHFQHSEDTVDPTAETKPAEDVPHQAQARQEAEAEPADPPVVQDAHRQHHPLQRQEAPLEEDQAQAVSQHRLWSRWEILLFITMAARRQIQLE